MKRCCILFFSMIILNAVSAQVKNPADIGMTADHVNKTLKSATGISVVSLLSQVIGGGLILSGMNMETDGETTRLAIGLFVGIGGVGMQTNSAILASRACEQVRMLEFSPEDSLLQRRMLKNIKTARTLSIIQNIIPVVAVAAGAISFSFQKSDQEYHNETFFQSPSFWIPTVSICFVGAILSIPEIVLLEKARSDLNSYQKKLAFGTTKNGVGLSYNF